MVKLNNARKASSPDAKASGLYALIEQLAAAASAGNCSKANRPYLAGFHINGKDIKIVRPPCKTWGCPQCAQTNRQHWMHRIAYGVSLYLDAGQEWMFGTLTAREDRRTFDKSLADWRQGWPKILKRLKRATPKHQTFRYVMLPEKHPQDDFHTLHMHLMANQMFGAHEVEREDGSTYWRSQLIADSCRECGLGYIHDWQPLRSEVGAAMYASKYIGKSLGFDDWPKYLRRVRTSNGWPELPPQPGDDRFSEWAVIPPDVFKAHLRIFLIAGYNILTD